MRAGIVVNVTGVDRRQLEAIIFDRSAPVEARVARQHHPGDG
jgi:hypothetical protein